MINQDGGYQDEKVNFDSFALFWQDRKIKRPGFTFRRLCDIDAEEFMMHGFDSDVSEDGDEPENARSTPETAQGSSRKHKK